MSNAGRSNKTHRGRRKADKRQVIIHFTEEELSALDHSAEMAFRTRASQAAWLIVTHTEHNNKPKETHE